MTHQTNLMQYSVGPQIRHVNDSDSSGFRSFPDFGFQLKMINEDRETSLIASLPLIG